MFLFTESSARKEDHNRTSGGCLIWWYHLWSMRVGWWHVKRLRYRDGNDPTSTPNVWRCVTNVCLTKLLPKECHLILNWQQLACRSSLLNCKASDTMKEPMRNEEDIALVIIVCLYFNYIFLMVWTKFYPNSFLFCTIYYVCILCLFHLV